MDLALFDLVASSKATQGGVYIRDGKGRLIVDRLDLDKKTGGNFFIAEFVVESSEKIPVVSAVDGRKLDVDPNPPGSSCSVVTPIDNPKIPSGPGNVKGFVLALLGYTEAEVTNAQFGKTLAQLVDRDPTTGQKLAKLLAPGRGMVIDYETYRKAKRSKTTEEIIAVKWTHVKPQGGNDKDSIAARRLKLDGAKPEAKK